MRPLLLIITLVALGFIIWKYAPLPKRTLVFQEQDCQCQVPRNWTLINNPRFLLHARRSDGANFGLQATPAILAPADMPAFSRTLKNKLIATGQEILSESTEPFEGHPAYAYTMRQTIYGKLIYTHSVDFFAGGFRYDLLISKKDADPTQDSQLQGALDSFSLINPRFTSSQGFSITPPNGWVVANKDTIHQVGSSVEQQFPKLGNIDFNQMAVMILNPADSGTTTLNVVVSPGKFSVDESGAEDKLAGLLRAQYSQMGVSLDRISVTRKVFGTHTALVADFVSNRQEASMRQWQVILPAGNHTLVVTCTAPQSSFDEVTPVFTTAIESMTISTFAFDWSALLQATIIGGVIGGLYGLFKLLSSSRKKI